MPHFVSKKRMGYLNPKKCSKNRVSRWKKMGKLIAKLKFKVCC